MVFHAVQTYEEALSAFSSADIAPMSSRAVQELLNQLLSKVGLVVWSVLHSVQCVAAKLKVPGQCSYEVDLLFHFIYTATHCRAGSLCHGLCV